MINRLLSYLTKRKPEEDKGAQLHYEYAEWPAPLVSRARIEALPAPWLSAVQQVYPEYRKGEYEPFIEALCEYWPVDTPEMDAAQIAYAIATIEHECSFKSVAEKRADPSLDERNWRIWQWQQRYWHTGYYGRGPAQLTWRENYVLFGRLLGIPLAQYPDLALDITNGVRIVLIGMHYGLFRKHTIGFYVNLKKRIFHWREARNVYNGDVALNGAEIGKNAERLYLTWKNTKA